MNLEFTKIQERWFGYCKGKSVAVDARNATMMISAVYEHLLCHCNTLQQSITDEVQPQHMQLFLMKILYTIDSVVEQWQVVRCKII